MKQNVVSSVKINKGGRFVCWHDTRVVLKSHCIALWSTEVHHAIYKFVFSLVPSEL